MIISLQTPKLSFEQRDWVSFLSCYSLRRMYYKTSEKNRVKYIFVLTCHPRCWRWTPFWRQLHLEVEMTKSTENPDSQPACACAAPWQDKIWNICKSWRHGLCTQLEMQVHSLWLEILTHTHLPKGQCKSLNRSDSEKLGRAIGKTATFFSQGIIYCSSQHSHQWLPVRFVVASLRQVSGVGFLFNGVFNWSSLNKKLCG